MKGVEIARYRQREKLSQGKREWFDERRYLAAFPNRQPFPHARIATQRITGVDERLRIVAAIIQPTAYFADSTNSVSVAENSPYRLGYLLAILNSRLMQWRFKLTSSNNNVGTNELDCLPFRKLDLTDSAERALHDRLVQMVEAMLKAKAQISTAKTDSDRTYLADKCAGLDRQIDQLVYELYDLTEEEIALVEST